MLKMFSRGPIHDPTTSSLAGTEMTTTTCYMCACRCGIRVHLKDGQARYIDGNPDHPINKGVICAKGSSGIMKQVSPARLTQPLLRRPGSDRGDGEFDPISWEEAFKILTERLARIRAADPRQFALFTGRDQMQALTSLFARQFGTPNYAAHGGFCSVNMAAGMIYTVGGSFWEFGGPDLDHAKLFVMIGTAEDHHSNPMKIALGKFKREGGRFISINPVRTGYSAIADEWIPIKPWCAFHGHPARAHRLRADRSPVPAAVHQRAPIGGARRRRTRRAIRLRPGKRPPRRWPQPAQQVGMGHGVPDGRACLSGRRQGQSLALEGHFTLADGTRVAPAFQLLRERVATNTPEWAEEITGIPAARIRKLAREIGETALHQAFELPIPWTDAWGKRHETTQGRPVAFHAMRGLAAHSNGFQTVRALAVLMSVLGTIDAPGGFRHTAPYPRHIVPNFRAFNDPAMVKPNTPLNAAPLGFPASPEELAICEDGTPPRIDHAFSWEHPLSAHGLMHNVITNAVRGDPYPIDTLLIFMANMARNSTMNTMEVRSKLNAKGADGNYKIPFLAVCDAFQSEMAMYHSWDSQNAWLRQIHSHNYLHVNPVTALAAGIEDGGWAWVTSQWGHVRCMVRHSDAVEPGTVWTWNAIGKASGAWHLAAGADESRKGFLLNHLITEELPFGEGHISNSDPITGQAGWYDVRVSIKPAHPQEPDETFPQIATMPATPGMLGGARKVVAYFANKKQ